MHANLCTERLSLQVNKYIELYGIAVEGKKVIILDHLGVLLVSDTYKSKCAAKCIPD